MVLFMLKNFLHFFPLPFGELSMVGLDIDLVVFQLYDAIGFVVWPTNGLGLQGVEWDIK